MDAKSEIVKQVSGTRWEQTVKGMLDWDLPLRDIQLCLGESKVMALFAQCFDTPERTVNGGRELVCSPLESNRLNYWVLDALRCDGLLADVVDVAGCEFIYAFGVDQWEGKQC